MFRVCAFGVVGFEQTHWGVIVQRCYGYAYFEGFPDRVLFHAKDCAGNMRPNAGESVSAVVHRRRKDGKLQAFRVEPLETMEERLDRVHNTLLGSS